MKTEFSQTIKRLIKERLDWKERKKIPLKPIKITKKSNPERYERWENNQIIDIKIKGKKSIVLDTLMDKKHIWLFSKNHKYMSEVFFNKISFDIEIDLNGFLEILVFKRDGTFNVVGSKAHFDILLRDIALKIMGAFNRLILIHVPKEIAPIIFESDGYYLVLAPRVSREEYKLEKKEDKEDKM